MKSKKKNKNSMAIAVYFGIAVLIIIVISLIFKGVDLLKESKFDSNYRLTVAVLGDESSHIISVSPKDGTIFRLNLKGHITEGRLRELALPIDGFVALGDDQKILGVSPRSEFSKFIFNRNIKTNLTIADLLRLSIFSGGVDTEKTQEEEAGVGDESKINDIASNFLKDPTISTEKISIQITNSTSASGLGNKLAKYIGDLGGVVVLVNSSSEKVSKSKIVAEEKSETVKRLSKILNIPYEKGQGNAISDVIILLGDDKKDLFK